MTAFVMFLFHKESQMTRFFVLAFAMVAGFVYQEPPTISIGSGGVNQKEKSTTVSREEFDALRWEIDDLKLRTRTHEEMAEALKIAPLSPESCVVVSADYPKDRLPYGVRVDDRRPKEVQEEDRKKGRLYMWLGVDLGNGKELRTYMTKIDYNPPKTAEKK